MVFHPLSLHRRNGTKTTHWGELADYERCLSLWWWWWLFSWEMVTEADYDENAYNEGDDTNNAHSYW